MGEESCFWPNEASRKKRTGVGCWLSSFEGREISGTMVSTVHINLESLVIISDY
jgi:hypothetical protein